MDPAEDGFNATAFTQNRPRLEEQDVIALFFDGVVKRAVDAGLTSNEHFCIEHFFVDGTLIDGHAAMKSVRPIGLDDVDESDTGEGGDFKPCNPDLNFRGQRGSHATRCSATDPEARFYRKATGQPSRLCHMSHAVTKNRNDLILAARGFTRRRATGYQLSREKSSSSGKLVNHRVSFRSPSRRA
jgi:hypothetical protein